MMTVFNVLKLIPVATTTLTNAVSAIKDAIYTVKVTQPEPAKVKQDLEELGIDEFTETCTTVEVIGIHPDNMKRFLNRLAEDFEGINAETRTKMDGYIFGENWESSVFEVKYNSEAEATYLMIAIEQRDGKYNFRYVGCKMELQISETAPPEIKKEILFGLFVITEEGKAKEPKISMRIIRELENYIRFTVAKKFKDSRVFDAIKA